MNRILAIKSGLVGLVAGVTVVLLIGAAAPQAKDNTATKDRPAAVSYYGSQAGRYQVASSAAMFVILDTATGQAWMGDFHNTLVSPNPAFFDAKLVVQQPDRRWE